jgi:serine/threonine protein kinase
MALENGVLLNNRYRIVETLGQGGMGAVYRANDENLGVQVAVKENLYLSEEYGRQFKLEATILAALRHPNLPRVGDHFVISGQGQYLVMDFIEGDDLRQRIEQSGPVSEEEAVRIGRELCDALIYLHGRQPPVVHRDLKPGNVKLTPDGNIVLVDFGLAKVMLSGQATTTGARAMTPGFSPPEQYGTARTDPRTDIYSLGATLYMALTGVIPEDGLARATGNAQLTSLQKLHPRINRRLAAAVEKSLALRPDERFQTAEEFKQALEEAAASASQPLRNTATKPPKPPPPPEPAGPLLPVSTPVEEIQAQPGSRRISLLATMLGALVLLLVVGSIALAFLSPGGMNLGGLISQARPLPSATPTRNETVPTTAARLSATIAPTTPLATSANQAVRHTPTPAEVIHPLSSPSPTLIPGPTQTPQPTSTPLGGSGGQIAFVSERNGQPQVWLMNADGSNQHAITSQPNGACQPDWSPDGQRLVFISPCSNRQVRSFLYPGASLYFINQDGTGLKPLPMAPEGDFDPHWSPDGKKIAFTSLRSGKPQIYLLDVNDLSIVPISNSDSNDKQPSWSPDGSEIVFVRQRSNTTNQIWLMAVDGSNQRRFSASGDLDDIWPTFSPDYKYILFGQTTVDLVGPWLMAMQYEKIGTRAEVRVPASQDIQLTTYTGEAEISPDSFLIAFEGWSGPDSHDVYIMTYTGSSPIPLTQNSGLNYSPVWKPASK